MIGLVFLLVMFFIGLPFLDWIIERTGSEDYLLERLGFDE